jgi:rfaE bifunctional protein nucleotidyltransferase chain/domain
MILSWEILAGVVRSAKKQSKKIVFTNGCFDIIHAGHVSYLTKASKLGDILIVGLNSDDSVRKLKGDNRPVNLQNDRAIVLDALKPIDYVAIFEQDTPKEIIELLTPDVLVKGGDYNIEDIVGAEHVIQNGGEVAVIDFIEGKSTTNIINKMKK